MAVVTIYMSDRDPQGQTFTDRKAADDYDKMLEIAEVISESVQQHLKGLSEEQAEEFGLFIAKNKDQFATLLKGKTSDFDGAALVGPNDSAAAPLRAVK
jgi:uncharacterized protein